MSTEQQPVPALLDAIDAAALALEECVVTLAGIRATLAPYPERPAPIKDSFI